MSGNIYIGYIIILCIGCVIGALFGLLVLIPHIKKNSEQNQKFEKLARITLMAITLFVVFPFLTWLTVVANKMSCWQGGNSYCDVYINYQDPIISEHFPSEIFLQSLLPRFLQNEYCFSKHQVVCDIVLEYTQQVNTRGQYIAIVLASVASILACYWTIAKIVNSRNKRKSKFSISQSS